VFGQAPTRASTPPGSSPRPNLTTLQWANIAFTVSTGSLVIAGGRLGDPLGRRRMLVTGTVVFTLASAVAAGAPNPAVLIIGRAVMGVGAALILPMTLALIPPKFARSEQPRALGVWAAVAWGGQAAGPAFGGLLTQTIGWRWILLVNLPIAAATLLMVRAATAESRDENAPPGVDLVGVATTGGAAFALLSVLTAGQIRGFGDPLVLALFAAAVVLGVLFVLVERRVANPLVDLALFRRRPFDAALIANLAMNLTFSGTTFLLALYLQDVRGYDPMVAGLLLPEARAAGLSDHQIATLRDALVDSKLAQRILSSLSFRRA
jgi:MFS family permease